MSQFAADTAVEALGDGRFGCHISPSWNIADVPNGGYVLATVVRAMAETAAHPDPLSVTGHFLRPAAPDTAGTIRCELVRAGRAISTVRAELEQEGKVRLIATASMGELAAEADRAEPTLPPPDYPPPDACPPRRGEGQGIDLPIGDRLEVRMRPGHEVPGATGRPEIGGWARLLDGSPPDPLALVLFVDGFPPALYQSHGRVGWVPTVELTAHVRRRPAPGWIAARFTASDLDDGRIVEDGALWDETGALVARMRQLALLRLDPGS